MCEYAKLAVPPVSYLLYRHEKAITSTLTMQWAKHTSNKGL